VKIISVGEVLWDVFGYSEYLGGAPLNFSAASHRLGNSVALLTAVGADERGARVLEAMENLGLTTGFVQTTTKHPTGTAIISIGDNHDTVFTIDRPAAFDCVTANAALLRRVTQFAPDWLYFGTLTQTNLHMETTLLRLAENSPN
jgi:fructokinase